MFANGNTDIANAMRVASSQLSSGQISRPQRVVLVTDGRDTSGAPRDTGPNVARSLATRGITASALGIGVDYDASYLASVADSGRGNYEYIGDTAGRDRFLTRELQETGTTTGQDATARIVGRSASTARIAGTKVVTDGYQTTEIFLFRSSTALPVLV